MKSAVSFRNDRRLGGGNRTARGPFNNGNPWRHRTGARPGILTQGVLVSLLACNVGADPLDVWHLRNPFPQPYSLNAVAYGNGLFVAVGECGAVVLSADGSHWTALPRLGEATLRGVAFGGNRWVAVGDDGVTWVSDDGTNWTPGASATPLRLNAVAFGGGRFMAVGAAGVARMLVSGTNWVSVPTQTGRDLYGVTYGNGVFVAVGANGETRLGTTSLTTPGVPATTNTLRAVTFGDGQFVAVGNLVEEGQAGYPTNYILRSTDGIYWSRHPIAVPSFYLMRFDLKGIACGPGVCVAVGDPGVVLSIQPGVIVVSTNSSQWRLLEGSPSSFYLSGVAYGNGVFVAVGVGGAIFSSTDGANWVKRLQGDSAEWNDVIYAEGRTMAVGGLWGLLDLSPDATASTSVARSSLDGTAWQISRLPQRSGPRGLAYGNGIYVAADWWAPGWFRSTNGLDWEFIRGDEVWAVAFGQGRFVSIGPGFYTSVDGRDWVQTFGFPWVPGRFALAYGNGRFAALVNAGPVSSNLVSADGLAWAVMPQGLPPLFSAMTFGNGQFVAVGDHGQIYTSTDGSTWTPQTSGVTTSLLDVTYGHGRYVAVGTDFILSSVDGRTWSRKRLPPGLAFKTVSPGPNGTFVVAGHAGVIFQSDSTWVPILPGYRWSAATGFSFSFSQPPGSPFRVLASADLEQWSEIASGIATQAVTHVTDPAAAGRPRRFYRVISP